MTDFTVHSRFIQTPSLRFHALTCGDEAAPLVVLLHGFPEFSESWRDMLPGLAAAGFHAVAPDLRGYGQTDVPDSGYDVDTLSADIAGLIRVMRPEGRAHVVGHDWGGAVAYHLAATIPEVVDRLAVVNCPHPALMARRMLWPNQLRKSWYMFFFQLPWVPEWLLTREEGSLAARMIRSASVDKQRLTRTRLAPFAANFARPEVAKAGLAYYRTMFRNVLNPRQAHRLFVDYPRIHAPFRLVWAEEDVALSKGLTVGLEPFFERNPEVRYLPGVGHFATLEAPERVTPLLVEHLQDPR